MGIQKMLDTVRSRGLLIEDMDFEPHPMGSIGYKEFIIVIKVHNTLIRLYHNKILKRYYVVVPGNRTTYQTLDDAIDAIIQYKESN